MLAARGRVRPALRATRGLGALVRMTFFFTGAVFAGTLEAATTLPGAVERCRGPILVRTPLFTFFFTPLFPFTLDANAPGIPELNPISLFLYFEAVCDENAAFSAS